MDQRPRHLTIVCNPSAAEDDGLRQAIDDVRARGHRIDVCVPDGAEQVRVLAASAAAECDVVVCAGGDGTLNETVNGVLVCPGRRCAVAVVPFGTANDFATALGLSELSSADALVLAATGAPRPIDVGKANDRYFINVASGGFGAEVTASTSPWLKSLLGGLAYTLTGIAKAFTDEERTVRVRCPGWQWAGPLLMFVVGNSRLAGGGYEVAPDAVLDDGLLDLSVVPSVGLGELTTLIDDLFEERTINRGHIQYRQVPWVEVEAPSGLHVNLDGEATEANAYRFEVVPGALPFVLPVP